MSATRDRSQGVTFVYSNLYKIYKQGVAAAKDAKVPAEKSAKPASKSPGLRRDPALSRLHRAHVLKGAEIRKKSVPTALEGVKVREYTPAELLTRRNRKPEGRRSGERPAGRKASSNGGGGRSPIESLKDNLERLNDLHGRLRFMLQELEELSKD